MLSIVHAQQVPPRGGETGFVDMRAARATLSAPLLERAAKAAIHASVREIKDFRGGDEEDFAMFPKVAVHPLLANHYVDSGPLLYVGSPHMKVHACVEINQWHAIEQASRRWRGGRRDDSARTRRKILISTQPPTQGLGARATGC